MRDHYRQQERIFAQTVDDRRDWEHTTAGSRHWAIAADAELRRRHPEQRIEPLRSAEPTPVSDTGREQLPLVLDPRIGELPTWVCDLAAQRQAFHEKLKERHRNGVGEAFPARQALGQDAILQPPRPQITPSAKILQLAAGRDISLEAAD